MSEPEPVPCGAVLSYDNGMTLRCRRRKGHRGVHADRNGAWANLGAFTLPEPRRTAK